MSETTTLPKLILNQGRPKTSSVKVVKQVLIIRLKDLFLTPPPIYAVFYSVNEASAALYMEACCNENAKNSL
jgi:hypothetical protein